MELNFVVVIIKSDHVHCTQSVILVFCSGRAISLLDILHFSLLSQQTFSRQYLQYFGRSLSSQSLRLHDSFFFLFLHLFSSMAFGLDGVALNSPSA